MTIAAVIGSSGAIGSALVEQLSLNGKLNQIYAFSTNLPGKPYPNVTHHKIDYSSEESIAQAAKLTSQNKPFSLVIVATGILHNDIIKPEKSLRDLSKEKFQHLFTANTITPALIAKYFLPKMDKKGRSIFTAISARVGSISDNHLGGWYSYRASKAALNMVIKNAAIEVARYNKQSIIVGLHPGTVDSKLSKPFQSHTPQDKIFTPQSSAQKLISVIDRLTPQDSGKCFAWDGTEIKP